MPNCTLRREYLNAGGYTSSGQYFGRGEPLYWYSYERPSDEGWRSHVAETGYVRGSTRAQAKLAVKAKWPDATFYQ